MGSRFGIDATLTEGEIALDGTQTSLVFKINGRSMGVCLSDHGNHAEINLIALLRDGQNGRLSPDMATSLWEQGTSALGNGTSFVDVFITRSPCDNCTASLIAWVNGLRANAQIQLRLFCLTIYKGESSSTSIDSINRLRAVPRIRVWRWDVESMAKAQDEDSRKVLQVAYGVAMNEATGFQVTNLYSRLGAPNLTDLPCMPLNDPTNFYVTS
jgi:hypothetical protein